MINRFGVMLTKYAIYNKILQFGRITNEVNLNNENIFVQDLGF